MVVDKAEDNLTIYKVDSDEAYVIEPLTCSIKKSHSVHACWLNKDFVCAMDDDKKIIHCQSIQHGGKYILNTDPNGYPPRCG